MNAVLAALIVTGVAAALAAPSRTAWSAMRQPLETAQHLPRDRRDTGIYIGPGSFTANVNVNNTSPFHAVATASAATTNNQGHQPAGGKVTGLHIGEGNFSPTINGQRIRPPSLDVPQVSVNLNNANSPAIATVPELSTNSQSQHKKDQPKDSSGPAVYGVNIGDGNFSPNVNVPSVEFPSLKVPSVSVSVNNAKFPAIEKSGASQPQQNQPMGSSGPTVLGVNFGDGNFSPNVHVPSISNPSMNLPKIVSPPATVSNSDFPLLKVPGFG